MRSAAEFFERQKSVLPMALKRPSMFCGTDACCDRVYSQLLQDLCWLENREADFTKVASELLRGSMKAHGQFLHQPHTNIRSFANEIASTYAQVAHRLGFYQPARLLTASEYEDLIASLTTTFFQNEHHEPELIHWFGPFSHEAVGGETTVISYACVDATRHWIHFDLSRCYPPEDRITHEWFPEPILRSVRRDRNHFEWLPFAKWCRGSDERQKDSDYPDRV